MADNTADRPEEPSESAAEKLTLDANSFNAAERMECQIHFDAPFRDLLACIFEAVASRSKDQPTSVIRIVDRDGVRHFPDQIIQFMVWVQAKRDDPTVELSAFDDMVMDELEAVHVRGLLGKARSGSKWEVGETVDRGRLCRFFGLTWTEVGQLSWVERDTLSELMAEMQREGPDDGTTRA